MLIKGDIAGQVNPIHDKIQATVASMTIAKEDTCLRSKFKFMSRVRTQERKAFATEYTQQRIVR